MTSNDSAKRRNRAIFLRGQKRPGECACLLWGAASLYIFASGELMWNKTYIQDDLDRPFELFCILGFSFMLPFGIHTLVGYAALVFYAWALWKFASKVEHFKPLQIPALLLYVPLTVLALARTEWPVRVAFLLNRSSFEERLLAGAKPEFVWSDLKSAEEVGAYRVHAVISDVRGGTYFLLPEQFIPFIPQDDYFFRGFVHAPNSSGSPFSDHRYELTRLIREWYFFRARSAPR